MNLKKEVQPMFYYSKNSRNKIIHVHGCHYIKKGTIKSEQKRIKKISLIRWTYHQRKLKI